VSGPTVDTPFASVRARPEPTPITRSFWEATARGEFLVQRCRACGAAQFYPRVSCLSCGSQDLADEVASGRGVVHAFSVARRPTTPRFTGLEPYVVAIVELEEGPRVTTNIVGVDPDRVRVDMAVEVCFEPVGDDGIAVPVFRAV
jgi:uncharacterized protein